MVTRLDEEDFACLGHLRWRVVNSLYAYIGRGVRRDGRRSTELLHRRICGLSFGDPREVHHVNGDRFDNRRSNLEVIDALEHRSLWTEAGQRNGRSRFRGVIWTSAKERWRVKVIYRGVTWTGRLHIEESTAAEEARELRGRLEAGERPPLTPKRRALLKHHAEKRARGERHHA